MNEFKKIHTFQRKEYVTDFAIQLWFEISSEAIRNRGHFTVALSGGNTPIEFYKKLSLNKEQLLWDKTHVFLVDERFVSFEDKDSNYKLIKQCLLDPVEMKQENIHFISKWEENVERSAEKYERIIRDFFRIKEGDFPQFDLIMLGIGEDGHTASIFPGTKALSEDKRIVVGVKPSKAKHERIGFTIPIINNARNIVFLITGSQKASIVERVLKEKNPEFPATMIAPHGGRFFFLLDNDAGSLLP